MRIKLKCMIVLAIVAASISNYVFAKGTDSVIRDTVVLDQAKQESVFTFSTRLQGSELNWIKISVKSLPQSVTQSVGTRYPDYTIKEAFEDDKKEMYKLLINSPNKGSLNVFYDRDGKFLEERP